MQLARRLGSSAGRESYAYCWRACYGGSLHWFPLPGRIPVHLFLRFGQQTPQTGMWPVDAGE